MNTYTYDHELITMTNQFLTSMSDIVIKRFNVHKETRDQIKVRILYVPKQRVLADLLDKDQNLQLPVMSVQIGGISRDQERVANKILGTFHTPKYSTASLHEKTPLPVDVKYNVSILARYQQDMDQIISHLIPYINPYFVISWRTPNRPEHETRSKVVWDGNVNMQYPTELNANTVARVTADLSFTFKGWVFQSLPESIENIHVVETNLITEQTISSEYLTAPCVRY